MTDIEKKISFVNELSAAIFKVQGNVEEVRYEVYKNKKSDSIIEFLIISYVGSAISVRNCTGNSYSAIFREISRMLDHGYYEKLSWYSSIINDDNYVEIFK